jgi:hypothetical protein
LGQADPRALVGAGIGRQIVEAPLQAAQPLVELFLGGRLSAVADLLEQTERGGIGLLRAELGLEADEPVDEAGDVAFEARPQPSRGRGRR